MPNKRVLHHQAGNVCFRFAKVFLSSVIVDTIYTAYMFADYRVCPCFAIHHLQAITPVPRHSVVVVVVDQVVLDEEHPQSNVTV